MWSCSSDELNNETNLSENEEITRIEAISLPFDFGNSDARTAITMGANYIDLPVWAEGDTIGIYPSAGGDQLSFPITDGVGTNTCVFTGGGWALKASTSTTTYTYTAYTPFDRSYYLRKDNTSLPFSMLGQKQVGNNNSDHLGAYDLQIANGDTPTSGKINFAFQHRVAIVRMDITAPNAAYWKSITLKSLAEFTIIANINLSIENPTVIPTDKSYTVTLGLENVFTTDDDLHIVAYMMMLPVDFSGKTLEMELMDVDGNVYTAPVSIDNPTNVANPLIFGEANARWISAEFEKNEAPYLPYITFSAEKQQGFKMSKSVESLEYSLNGNVWKELNTNSIQFGGSMGNLRLRGKNLHGTATSTSSNSIVLFENETPVACSGDIRTLLDYENYKSVNTSQAKFCGLFYNCYQLISSPELPCINLANYCYYQMFSNCSNLNSAPLLPATRLVGYCYEGMFSGCIKLSSTPELPATTLAIYCYSRMFANCSNLFTVSELPATSLMEGCYESMFSGCSSLVKGPDLLATNLADCCYESMFHGCESMTTAPELPAVSISRRCYRGMFEGCKNLIESPVLPAKTLANLCYEDMFSNCSKLRKITMLAIDISAERCLSSFMYRVSSTGTFIKAKAMSSLSDAFSIPSGWTVVDYEELK